MKEGRRRSILKGVTFRIVATLITMALVFIYTGNMAISLGLGVFETVSKLVLYYLHERVWNKIGWGLKERVG